MISLAGGLPDPQRFPIASLRAATAKVLAEQPVASLQYGETRGTEATRSTFAARLSGEGDLHVDAEDIVVTTGSQQALDLLARVLLDPGDAIVVSDPDYLGALQVFRAHGASLHAAPVDAEGMQVDALEDLLAHGLRPKLCYLVPNFHNPTGASLSEERRVRMAELSARYGFVVVEDDPYRDLWIHTEPSLMPGDPELTVRLRSVSKILAPGLRVGALAGPQWLTNAIVTAKQSTDLHTSSLNQLIVAEALGSDWLEPHLGGLRMSYAAKRDALLVALERAFGARVACNRPAGGMFVWVRFADVDDTGELLQRALAHNVCFVPGNAFAVERDLARHARFSYATATPNQLGVAITQLAAAA
jgi:2-aminoadipate transaminase